MPPKCHRVQSVLWAPGQYGKWGGEGRFPLGLLTKPAPREQVERSTQASALGNGQPIGKPHISPDPVVCTGEKGGAITNLQ